MAVPAPIFPGWVPTKVVPDRDSINGAGKASSSETTVTVAGFGSRAPLIYGRVEVTPQIAAVTTARVSYYNYLYILAVWAQGPINQVEKITYDGGTVLDAHTYLGTPTQGVDDWLAASITDYADTLRGTINGQDVSLAYSVIRSSSTKANPLSDLKGIIRGREIYDPRITSSAYSTNPALIILDLLTLAGEDIDWTASLAAINYCDETLGDSSTRWTLNIAISNPTAIPSLIEGYRAYAHCILARSDVGIYLVPDDARATDHVIVASDIVEDSLRLVRASRNASPTAIRVQYTKTDVDPWDRGYAEAVLPGAEAGTTPLRESNIDMPGIQSYQEAKRTAIERLNAFTLRDLSGSFTVFDEGLQITPGDVLSVTHPIGLSSKLVRVIDAQAKEPGRIDIAFEEYDPAVYTENVYSEPTSPDTGLPSPFDVPAPTNLVVTEEVFALENGLYSSRFRITWNSDDYAYTHRYYVAVEYLNELFTSAYTVDNEYATSAVVEGRQYTVRVKIVADVGVSGEEVTALVTAQGKQLVPGNVPSLSGFEVGGEVRLTWEPAVDIDIWRYEIRYGTTGGSWDTANRIDRVDGLRLVTRDVPAGTWRFYAKAIDSIGQYSATAATKDITVTLDIKAFFVGEDELDYTSGSNLYADVWRDGTIIRWSEAGSTVDTVFTNNADTYTDPAASYDGGAASEWLSETFDLGDIYVGNWQWTQDCFSALGTGDSITVELELSTDNSVWAEYTDPAVKVSARYARVRVSATSGNVLLQDGTLPTVRLDVVTREETGTITTVATGASTVTLSQTYQFANWVGLQPSGTINRTAVYDNVQVGDPTTFDVYLFDYATGNQVSGDVSWRFQGV